MGAYFKRHHLIVGGAWARVGVLQCEAIALDVLPVKLRATIICSNEHAHLGHLSLHG